MQATLRVLQPELEKSAILTAETMKKIEKENLSVENATKQVKKDEDAANEQAEVSRVLKEECEADLAEALPVLEDALGAVLFKLSKFLLYVSFYNFQFSCSEYSKTC